MLEVSNVRLPLDAGIEGAAADALVRAAAAHVLGVASSQVKSVRLLRRSVDARKKRDVHFVATLAVELASAADEACALAVPHSKGTPVRRYKPAPPLAIPDRGAAYAKSGEPRPVVVGSGPAGLFCALYLARAGLRPLVLERGGSVAERQAAVAAFAGGGPLDGRTNIQFGEGGAGTFSDGKLTTNTKSPFARHVLQWFVDAGAPREILWQAKPHIGTDRLVGVVAALRSRIQQAGGEVRFHAQLVGVRFDGAGKLREIEVCDGRTGVRTTLPARRVVLACGHSARDTFAALHAAGVSLEQKPFSVGVRIEHPQALIDRAQYGEAAAHPALGSADYKLAVHLPPAIGENEGRGVYTFCMCPGGEVVCAASEEGGVAVNGMSRFARDGRNANSALLVGVGPDDFPGAGPLAGIELQRRMERAAFRAAGSSFAAPAQTVGDFLAGRSGTPSKAVVPTYARGVAWCDLHDCLPPFVSQAYEAALPLLDRKLPGFAHADAIMTGVETRSSSPVRIVRGSSLQACLPATPATPSGLYPCGEGAGYAGGIMSAACDGLRVAQAVAEAF